jgi:hypothetical protein
LDEVQKSMGERSVLRLRNILLAEVEPPMDVVGPTGNAYLLTLKRNFNLALPISVRY